MSEHHRGAWGAREDAVWWPGPITTPDQQTLQSHHQHLLNQHHQQQQQLAAAQQQQQQQAQQAQQQQQAAVAAAVAAQQQQQHDVVRSTAASTHPHQLFSYKMASSFQSPATTGSPSSVAPTSPVTARGYDYRLAGGMVNVGGAPAGTPPPSQWWYANAMDNAMQNMQNASPVRIYHRSSTWVSYNSNVP